MKLLFVHQNGLGQYTHLIRHFLKSPEYEVVLLTQRRDVRVPGLTVRVYAPQRPITPGIHHYLRETEAGVLNAQAAVRVALDLRAEGFVPDIMIGHNGWGEIWYLKDVFPQSPLLGYFEFFYRLHGADVGFDPTVPVTADDGPRLRTKNLGNLLALDCVDAGQCATLWQKSLYPARYHPLLHVVHEGIDTRTVKPDANARLRLPDGRGTLTRKDRIVTYVARNLEPYRGFPALMRAVPAILAHTPEAQIVIVGGEGVSYGPPLATGQSYREALVAELRDQVDWTHVHFLGQVPYATFLAVLQVSTVHVYLTQPFVLSWSLLEAMAAGCVVVGSATAPVTEVITAGHNGLLVDFFAVDTLARTVTDVLADPAAYGALGGNARATIRQHYDLAGICLPRQLALIAGLTGQELSLAPLTVRGVAPGST